VLDSDDDRHKLKTNELMPLHYFSKFIRPLGVSANPATTIRQSEYEQRQEEPLQETHEVVSRFQRWTWISSSNLSLQSLDLVTQPEKLKHKANKNHDSVLSLWTNYRQLEHCSWWSLSYTFGNNISIEYCFFSTSPY
jgi:hypothetical protein